MMVRSLRNPDYESVSAQSLRNVFDHVVDPTDDLVDILTNQLSDGDSVAVGSGTHTIELTNQLGAQITKNHVTVWLHPNATVTLADSQVPASPSSIHRPIEVGVKDGGTAVTDFTLCGTGTLDGNRANNGDAAKLHFIEMANSGVTRPTIRDVTIQNVGGNVVQHTNGSDLKIEGVTFDNIFQGPNWDSPRARIRDCIFDTFTDGDGVEPLSGADDFVIAGNTFLHMQNDAAIDIFGGVNGVVRDNYIEDTAFKAISMGNGSVECTIVGNIVVNGDTDQGATGAVQVTADSVVRDNRVIFTTDYTIGQYGILVEGARCRIIDNYVENANAIGINVAADDCLVRGNICVNNGDSSDGSPHAGIFIGRGVVANNARVVENRCYNDGADQKRGIYLEDGDGHVVNNNDCRGNANVAIEDRDGDLTDTVYNDNDGLDVSRVNDPCPVNGMARESANAESPTGTNIPNATAIDFTDTGDGSGDGVYYKDHSGSIHGPL